MSATLGAAVGRRLPAPSMTARRLTTASEARESPRPRHRRAERDEERDEACEDLGRSDRPKRKAALEEGLGHDPHASDDKPERKHRKDRSQVRLSGYGSSKRPDEDDEDCSTQSKVAATTSWLATNEGVKLASRTIAGPGQGREQRSRARSRQRPLP